MNDINNQIQNLTDKLDLLLKKQDNYRLEILQLKEEIVQLKLNSNQLDSVELNDGNKEKPTIKEHVKSTTLVHENPVGAISIANPVRPSNINTLKPQVNKPSNINLEKFIGENLISKIGIIITVIGVAIGAKYSIEHHLISPLTRIILGYLIGGGLLITGIKLKSKFETYSAVLVSGAMAIIYFLTYAAYDFYGLIPQVAAFTIMVVFTAFTVFAAIQYNQQVIAHIGLVGAYAVPFLLSEGKGQVAILFTYTAIINIGILIIAIKKYWKSLYYAAFGITWMLFCTWLFSSSSLNDYRSVGLVFVFIFFLLFYAVFLVYKLIQKENYDVGDVIMIFFNSFIFYGSGYYLIGYHDIGSDYLGLFTLVNAIVHFIVCTVIYRQKLADRNLFYLVAGLVIVFITITIPVQLNGNWVTLLWAFEAALLFWVGRTKAVLVYEKLSTILILLAFLSLVHDWILNYDLTESYIQANWMPLFNVHFLSSLLVLAAFIFLFRVNKNTPQTATPNEVSLANVFNYMLPAIIIAISYFAIKIEITHYFKQLYMASEVIVKHGQDNYNETFYNDDIMQLEKLWSINYSLVYFSILGFINVMKLKSKELLFVNLAINVLVILILLTEGLSILNELRSHTHLVNYSPYYSAPNSYVWIRYICFALLSLLLLSSYKNIRAGFNKLNFSIPFDAVLHLSILWVLSNELMNLLEGFRNTHSDKLGLSILWGAYALFLISCGIWKKKMYLRFGAIALFSITLLKLFFYDIAHLNTISKTIVFVSLGLLLLIISFLYHKFKALIIDENEA